MPPHGMTEDQAREFLERQLGKNEATTRFYWDNEEVEEALDLIVEAVAKLVAANNARIASDAHREWLHRGHV